MPFLKTLRLPEAESKANSRETVLELDAGLLRTSFIIEIIAGSILSSFRPAFSAIDMQASLICLAVTARRTVCLLEAAAGSLNVQ